MVHLAAAMYGYRVVCPDLDRGKDVVAEVVGLLAQTSLQTCEDARPVALLLEHVDDQECKGREYARDIQKRWTELIRDAEAPRSVLLITCEDAWDKRMTTLRGSKQSPASAVIHFPPLAPIDMRTALLSVCTRGGLPATHDEQAALLDACNGRMRSAMLSLQFLCAGKASEGAGAGASSSASALPLSAACMKLDTLMSTRDTAHAALSTGALLEHAAADVEGVTLALHAALHPRSLQAAALFKQVFDLTHRESAIGYIGLAEFLPAMLLVLVTGAVADRFDRRKIASAPYAVAWCAPWV
jgi:hypothetical protein